jgi:hypothetical protein
LSASLPVYAAWEAGAKAGYDSNVNRTVDDPESDTFLGAYLLYAREVSGETRLDWTVAASVEGNEYLKNSDLSNAGVTLAPGLVYFPYLSWSINVYPFVQGKIYSDNDQSAIAFGAKINLKQPLGKYFYLGEYYIYSDSRAENDIYSSVENAAGVVMGVNWTRTLFTEIGYEYSEGDSFRTVETESTSATTTNGRGRGRGMQHGYSSTFSTEVYKDKVQRQSIGVTIGAELFPSVFSTLSYTYSAISGDLGDSESHTGMVSIGYRF